MMFESEYGSMSFVQENNETINSDYYYKFILMIGVYYTLPALQFVFFQATDENAYCYYNFDCIKPVGIIPAFNNFISNIFYIIFGLIFIITVRLTYTKISDGIVRYGVTMNPGLYYTLGIALIMEGVCSGIYHICPSKLNFQFDTTFMFMGAALIYLTLYQKRHYYDTMSPMKFFTSLSAIIFINFLPLAGLSTGVETWFWVIIFFFVAYYVVFGTIYIYFGKDYDINMKSVKDLISNCREVKNIPKIIMVSLINMFTLGMYTYAVITKPNFTDWMLSVFIINMIIYFTYYTIQKLRHNEKIRKIWWFFFITDIIIISFAIKFYLIAVTDKLLTPDESRHLNKPCVLLNYFDYHDIWHMLSSLGLYIFFNLMYFIDYDLNNSQYECIDKF
jgi:hypothetical protein